VEQAESWERGLDGDGDASSLAWAGLMDRIADACESLDEWPTQVGAGVYAAIDYFVEEPLSARALMAVPGSSSFGEPFLCLIRRVTQLLGEAVPLQARPRSDTPAGVIAGVGLLVGEHVRTGRGERLLAMRPELHLLLLLPFLDFERAKEWVALLDDRQAS
jgi:hypothetical protein